MSECAMQLKIEHAMLRYETDLNVIVIALRKLVHSLLFSLDRDADAKTIALQIHVLVVRAVSDAGIAR